jgi:hypothetical protein
MQTKTKGLLQRVAKAIPLVVFVVACGISVATPARAEWERGHDRGGHAQWHHRPWGYHPAYAPGYVAPPPAVYYPPPQPSAGLNLIVPLHIR